MPGHKGLYGPQGTGVLLIPKDRTMSTLIEGGTGSNSAEKLMPDFLPDRFEAGTQNAHGLAGLREGIRFIKRRGDIFSHGKELLRQMLDRLDGTPRLRLYAAPHQFCQSGVLSFSVDGIDSVTAASILAERGIAVRGGLHCAPCAHKTADTYPSGTVRVSVSAFNQPSDMRICSEAIKGICKLSKNLANNTSHKYRGMIQ
jgi:selenocysteine lyase/cysteine desulfurase